MRSYYLEKPPEDLYKTDGPTSMSIQRIVSLLSASLDYLRVVIFALMAVFLLLFGTPESDAAIEFTKTQLLAICAVLMALLDWRSAREKAAIKKTKKVKP